MRCRNRSADEPVVPFDLTPLIDVVFLLLIFFMAGTRFMDPRGFEVELPEAATPQSAGAADVPVMVVAADGTARWQGHRLAAGEALDVPEGTSEVLLRVDRQARHGDVIRWIDALKAAGVASVTLATSPVVEKSAVP